MSELVGVGVPAYRGVAYVAEALRCLAEQTHRNLDVLISVDGGDEATAAACQPFLKDSRFKLAVQPTQLGWAQNISWLMAHNEGEFWYYHQQDDLVRADYVSVLLELARANAQAAVVYSDIQCFGENLSYITQAPVLGSAVTREIALLLDHHSAVAFRGLTRRNALQQTRGVRENEVENFSSDTVWMASAARAGELLRVPRALYRKRYHRDNVHTKWPLWPLEKRLKAWQVHCRDMFLEASRADASTAERQLIWGAAVARLVSPRTSSGYVPAATFDVSARKVILEGFLRSFTPSDVTNTEQTLELSFDRLVDWSQVLLDLPRPTLLQHLGSLVRAKTLLL